MMTDFAKLKTLVWFNPVSTITEKVSEESQQIFCFALKSYVVAYRPILSFTYSLTFYTYDSKPE
jgi:hypothetical protein